MCSYIFYRPSDKIELIELTWGWSGRQVHDADEFRFNCPLTREHTGFYFNPVCSLVSGLYIQETERHIGLIYLQLHPVHIGWMLVVWIHAPVSEIADISVSQVNSGHIYSWDTVFSRKPVKTVASDILFKSSRDVFYVDWNRNIRICIVTMVTRVVPIDNYMDYEHLNLNAFFQQRDKTY